MNKAPTIAIFDEAAILRDASFLYTTPAEMRGFGLKCWFLYQSFSQAEFKNWPSGKLRGQCDVVTFFGGSSDKLSADEMSRYAGTDTITVPSASVQTGGKPGGSNTIGLTGRPNYTPDEISNLPLPRMLVHYAGVGIAEGRRFDPSLRDFSAYLAFMRVIEAGGSAQDAESAAMAVPAGMGDQPGTPPPAPKKQPRKPINLNPFSLADKALRKLMGHEDE